MATARKTGHRLRSGLWLPASVDSSYAISVLPVQSDMGLLPLWIINSQDSEPPKYARVTDNADKSRSPDGFLKFSLVISFMTFMMLDAWLDAFLPNGVESEDATCMTYDVTDTAMFIQATIIRPEFPSQDARSVPGGWAGVVWRFENGVQVTD